MGKGLVFLLHLNALSGIGGVQTYLLECWEKMLAVHLNALSGIGGVQTVAEPVFPANVNMKS